MALALYHPEFGFFSRGGGAGRRGDFLTSPEVGPLFGAVVARALDSWWSELGRPDPFVVVEAGAGVGTLASSVLHASPLCAPALLYVLVERSVVLRDRQAEHLTLESPAFAFAPSSVDDDEDLPAVAAAVVGPIVVSLAELPRVGGPAVVIANELLDNLPVDLLERTDDGWFEVRVGTDGEVLVPCLDPPLLGVARGRVPIASAAVGWLREARALGRVIAFDYADTTASLASRPWNEWLRTYRAHGRGTHPLEALGEQDITCEVPIDQLPAPSTTSTQADWLRAHGIDDLVDEGRRIWAERAPIGDLAALEARSRVNEAEALLDPTGLGAFKVVEWTGSVRA